MSSLGDFLELVCEPAEPYATVQALIRHGRHDEIADRASGGNATIIGRRKVQPAPQPQSETHLAVWLAFPDRIRIEMQSNISGCDKRSLTVANSQQSWTRDHEGHVETSEGRRQLADLCLVERHFDRARLREFLVSLALECKGEVHTAGHDCLRVRAIPRPDGRLWPHWIPRGADEYEFHCEPTRGAILTIIARCQGTEFEVNEVTSVTFDEPIDETLFSYAPKGGEQLRAAEPVVERLSLEAAVKRMPFAVLIPSRLPDPEHAHFEVLYHPPRLRSARPYLCLMYQFNFGRTSNEACRSIWISESHAADPDDDQFEWEHIEREGKRMRISDPGTEGMRKLALEQAGTHVSICSDLDRASLLDVAASLLPA